MSTVAFKVAAGEEFSGGSFAYSSDRKTCDIGQALEEGNGVIVTDDPLLAEALSKYQGLEETEVPEDAPVAEAQTVEPSDAAAPIQDVKAEHGDEDNE